MFTGIDSDLVKQQKPHTHKIMRDMTTTIKTQRTLKHGEVLGTKRSQLRSLLLVEPRVPPEGPYREYVRASLVEHSCYGFFPVPMLQLALHDDL